MKPRFQKHFSKKSQFAIEFVILLAVMFIIFLGAFSFATAKIIAAKEKEREIASTQLAQLVQSEILLAKNAPDGYQRTFDMPARVKGHTYNASIIDDRELVVHFVDQEFVLFLPQDIIGENVSAQNTIRKSDGIVYINS